VGRFRARDLQLLADFEANGIHIFRPTADDDDKETVDRLREIVVRAVPGGRAVGAAAGRAMSNAPIPMLRPVGLRRPRRTPSRSP